MEQMDPACRHPIKRLCFNEQVNHRQTYGKTTETGNYEVTCKDLKLPLIDEDCGEEIFTKADIIKLENQYRELLEIQKKGLPIGLEDPNDMKTAQEFFTKLDKLFAGSEFLPRLIKSNSRIPDRMEREHSAGVMTGTIGKSLIGRLTDSASWKMDEDTKKKLNELHRKAIEYFSTSMEIPTKKTLKQRMLKLREMNKTVIFTVGELCSFYLDHCRAKERMLSASVKESVEKLKTVEERMELLESYHRLNWIPLHLNTAEVDQEYLKSFLEKALDISFDPGTLTARYSAISQLEIKQYIRTKYHF